jgi:hydroxyacylglutathione hydrolase
MIIERVEHPEWTSNTYLVSDGTHGFIVDSNGVEDPLARLVDESGIELTHVLITHTDGDHVVNPERWGVPVLTQFEEGPIRSGAMQIEAIATPGHAREHYALLVDRTDCFTGDCLFKGTVGGTGNGGPNGYANQVDSIMNKLMSLPHETRIHPGHTLPSTIGAEWESNPFIRIWRGLDPEGTEPCRVRGAEATLILFGPDYDGTHKAWVRYPDGRDAIVGGSQIER